MCCAESSFYHIHSETYTCEVTMVILLQAIHALKDEIREINQRLIDTVIDISEESSVVAAAAEGGEGTIVKCSFSAVALSPNMKLQYASAQMVGSQE